MELLPWYKYSIIIGKGGARLCVGRAQLVEVGQNTSLSIALDEQETSK
jgi:hypothetical protein